ncbi:MAG: diversity-generating retroelement protein Avd [Sphaerospermopsis kisseleviana]
MDDLPIIQKTYDLVKWYVPILNRLPRNHKFLLGDRIITNLYEILDNLVLARYAAHKIPQLENVNSKLELVRIQTRLLYEFSLIDGSRYEYVQKLINNIGIDLGGWLKQQRMR